MAQTYVASAGGTGTPLTITSTTAGNSVYIVTNTTTKPASITTGGGTGQTATLQYCTAAFATFFGCVYAIPNTNASHTSIICTTCGSINYLYEVEFSGMDTTALSIDHPVPCIGAAGAGGCPAGTGSWTYTPGFAKEALIAAFNCSGSTSTIGGSSWAHVVNPNGNTVGVLTISAIATITATQGSGCNMNGALMIGFKAASAGSETCAADVAYYNYSTEAGASGNASVTANVNSVGDLFLVSGLCVSAGACTATTTLAAQSATATSVVGTPSTVTGKPFLFYVLSAAAAGTATLTLTPTGTRTGAQVSYLDLVPTAGCTFVHNIDSSLGTGGGSGTAVNTPSITPTAGDILFAFTAVGLHVASVNSPWSCTVYVATANCNMVSTVNANGYILSAASGATANNVTLAITGDSWEALISSFSLVAPSSGTPHGLLTLGAGH